MGENMKRMALLCWAAAVIAGGTSTADAKSPESFELRSMSGFRLIHPSYRASGDGMDVSVLVCRVIGWAASSPAHVHFLRAGNGSDELRHHDVRLARMGLRGGENCDRVQAHFVGPPQPGEMVTICLAYSHRGCE